MTIAGRSDASLSTENSGKSKLTKGLFFSKLLESDRLDLEDVGGIVRYEGGSTLFSQGAPASRCFNLIEGVIGLTRGSGDGRRQIVAFALPGDMLEIAALSHHELDGVAVGKVVVWEAARKDLERFSAPRSHVLDALRTTTASELFKAYDHMFSLGRTSAEERVVTFLKRWRDRLNHASVDVDPLPLPMSRREIADHLGLTIETVSRVFSKLARLGLIQSLPGFVRMLAIDGEKPGRRAIASTVSAATGISKLPPARQTPDDPSLLEVT